MKKLIVANWKMNPQSLREAEGLAQEYAALAPRFKNVDVLVAPPFVYLDRLSKVFRAMDYSLPAMLGAQDVFWEEAGAFTGEVSPLMLNDLQVKYVILGHSERRLSMNETDEMINKKVARALAGRLNVILCVGELKRTPEGGLAPAQAYVAAQLTAALAGVPESSLQNLDALVVAYEPVWAIGTGIPDTPEETVAMVTFIKQFLAAHYPLPAARVLYGGSVNGANAKSFLQCKEIDGALVGGASLKPEEFAAIGESV